MDPPFFLINLSQPAPILPSLPLLLFSASPLMAPDIAKGPACMGLCRGDLLDEDCHSSGLPKELPAPCQCGLHKAIGVLHPPVALHIRLVLRACDLFNGFTVILEKSQEEDELNECGQPATINWMPRHLLFKLLGPSFISLVTW